MSQAVRCNRCGKFREIDVLDRAVPAGWNRYHRSTPLKGEKLPQTSLFFTADLCPECDRDFAAFLAGDATAAIFGPVTAPPARDRVLAPAAGGAVR